PLDTHKSVYGWPQPWAPRDVSQNGTVLYGVLRDQYDEYAVGTANGGVPTAVLTEGPYDYATVYGVDDRGRVAYEVYNQKTDVQTDAVSGGGPDVSGTGCMRGNSSDGYVLVTLPADCSHPSVLRLYKPDNAIAWELVWPADQPRLGVQQAEVPQVLMGGWVT